MRPRRLRPEQHPHDVARACVVCAASEAYSETAELRACALDALSSTERSSGYYPSSLHTEEGDGAWMPAALHRWARGVRFVREPGRLGEVLLSARRTIATNMGDCDDVALAVCAMAMVFGMRATVAVRWVGPRLAHVAAVVAPDWSGSAPALVIDPQLEVVARLERGSPWRFGRLMPEVAPGGPA